MAFTKENAAIYSKAAHEAKLAKKIAREAQRNSTVMPLALPSDDYAVRTLYAVI